MKSENVSTGDGPGFSANLGEKVDKNEQQSY